MSERLRLSRITELLKFTEAADVQDDGVWHVAENPIEGDRTLCGIAHEGFGSAEYGVATFKSKRGIKVTCAHCIALIKCCREL